MCRLGISLSIVLLSSAAFGEQPQPTPVEQALMGKLSTEVNLGLKCSADLIELQRQFMKLQDQVKELQDKYESK